MMIPTRRVVGLRRLAAARFPALASRRQIDPAHLLLLSESASSSSASSCRLLVYPRDNVTTPTSWSLQAARLFSSTTTTNNDKNDSEEKSTNTATTSAADDAIDIKNDPKITKKETIEFKAETRQILKIMTHSLYTDKEVFIRELVSNASDALEKFRHAQAANTSAIIDENLPMEIRIDLDEVSSSITITDTGIGMTREDLIENLGTIARSGSRRFVEDLKRVAEGGAEVDVEKGIIGKFGVGFYAVFMVAEKVEVISRSALKEHEDTPAQVWTSDGSSFDLGELEEGVRQQRGTSIKIYLDSDFWHFVDETKLETILKKYSNFVGFPIYLMGKRLNSIDAIWSKDPKEVEEENYFQFYRYIANAIDDPMDTYHFRADAPLDIKALFFIPSFHTEKYGHERMEPSVSLYCRKVLIEANSKDILPDWMRFVKGVVDSEDLPLAISREKVQDSALIGKLRTALTRKFIYHLAKMAKNDRERYLEEFYKEYAFFLKEGVCQDFEFQQQMSKLLYFETSKNQETKMVSFDEYIANMRPEQKDIYYLLAPTRDAALTSPYLETFEKAGVEVLFVFTDVDDFVMGNLKEYEGRPLVSVGNSNIDLKDIAKDVEDSGNDDDIYKADQELTVHEKVEICNWFRKTFGEKLASCTITERLSNSPAIVTDHESGALRRMMRMIDTTEGSKDGVKLPKQHMEINAAHKIIVGIHKLREKQPVLAKVLAEQVIDNCLVAAGLMDDSRSMLPRLNDLLLCVVNGTSESENPAAFGEELVRKAKASEKESDNERQKEQKTTTPEENKAEAK